MRHSTKLKYQHRVCTTQNVISCCVYTLHWRHNDHCGLSNHQPHGCLLSALFRRRSKKTSKLRVTGLCVGNSPGPVNSPHKGPVTRKMFSFDDVIMRLGRATMTTPFEKSVTPSKLIDHACWKTKQNKNKTKWNPLLLTVQLPKTNRRITFYQCT